MIIVDVTHPELTGDGNKILQLTAAMMTNRTLNRMRDDNWIAHGSGFPSDREHPGFIEVDNVRASKRAVCASDKPL